MVINSCGCSLMLTTNYRCVQSTQHQFWRRQMCGKFSQIHPVYTDSLSVTKNVVFTEQAIHGNDYNSCEFVKILLQFGNKLQMLGLLNTNCQFVVSVRGQIMKFSTLPYIDCSVKTRSLHLTTVKSGCTVINLWKFGNIHQQIYTDYLFSQFRQVYYGNVTEKMCSVVQGEFVKIFTNHILSSKLMTW